MQEQYREGMEKNKQSKEEFGGVIYFTEGIFKS